MKRHKTTHSNPPEHPQRQQVFQLVREIPKGKVMSYGQIGQHTNPPIGPRQIGWLMHQAKQTDQVPWWRVVGSDGTIRLHKKDPQAAWVQEEKLHQEGVEFLREDRVNIRVHRWYPEEQED